MSDTKYYGEKETVDNWEEAQSLLGIPGDVLFKLS